MEEIGRIWRVNGSFGVAITTITQSGGPRIGAGTKAIGYRYAASVQAMPRKHLRNITSLRNVISEHLTNLADRFQFYFPAEEDPRKGNGWIRNPFISLEDGLSGSMEDTLLELTADGGLKRSFETTTSLRLLPIC